jgi:hypothetical protein
MADYEVQMGDRTVEQVAGADAYQQEGQMTTFFSTRRGVVDSWATRVASYRTSEILSVRRVESPPTVFFPSLSATSAQRGMDGSGCHAEALERHRFERLAPTGRNDGL